MGGVVERAAALEERGSSSLLATASTAGMVWGTIFVAGPGGGLAAVDLAAGEGVGIFELPAGEGAWLDSRLLAVVELVEDVGLLVFVVGVDGGEGSYSFFRAS